MASTGPGSGTLSAIGYEAVFPGEARKDLEPLPDEVRRKLDVASFDGGRKGGPEPGPRPGEDHRARLLGRLVQPLSSTRHPAPAPRAGEPDVAVRRINVGKWDNAAARQATREFGLEALPYVRVYDGRESSWARPRGEAGTSS